MVRQLKSFVVFGALSGALAIAGPYDEPGLDADAVSTWAARVIDYRPASGVERNPLAIHAIGAADGQTVSLGDIGQAELDAGMLSGTITVQFDEALRDGPGWDFAVFENAFAFQDDYVFAELGYVEVSTDGVAFARFPSISLSQDRWEVATSAFSGVNHTDIYNLAGKHGSGLGTPFDLSELALDPLIEAGDVRLQSIQFVRIVDIPGGESWQAPLRDANGEIAFADSLGNPILDAWNTASTGVAGFDLDAVGGRYIRDASYAEVLLANMFQLGTDQATGDLNGDGITDGADFNLWNAVDFVDPRQFRTIVPEPSCLRLWAVSVVLCLRFRVHRFRVHR